MSLSFPLLSLSPARENILKAVEGVKNILSLATWLGVGYVTNLEDVVEWFLKGQGRYQPSWRAVIFALDGIGEIYLADKIRSCGEPVQGTI